ncbi:MAG: hypothetical protein KAV87_65180 [Desulfobacteraceae bacterium]|nr:hypothetical protein [Desulfobacteraceae bacterium]
MSDFSKIESLENWIAWDYFRNELEWAIQKIAYVLDVNERKLMEWVNARAATMTRVDDQQPGKAKKIRAELREKYPSSQPVDRELLEIDVTKIAKLLQKDFNLREIAKKLKYKYDDFIFAYNRNLKLINAKLKNL